MSIRSVDRHKINTREDENKLLDVEIPRCAGIRNSNERRDFFRGERLESGLNIRGVSRYANGTLQRQKLCIQRTQNQYSLRWSRMQNWEKLRWNHMQTRGVGRSRKGKGAGGVEWFTSVPAFRRTAKWIHRGADEGAYRRSAEGREAFVDELQPMKGEGGGTR